MKSKCILSTPYTVTAALAWLVVPACFIAWLYSIIGNDPRLLFLGGVMLGPPSLVLLAPWLRAYLSREENLMTKKEIQERLFALWELGKEESSRRFQEGEDWLDWVIWQKKPNTAVRIVYHGKPKNYYDFGFTKVQYPDVWDAHYGIALAVKKALASIARQIVEDENG